MISKKISQSLKIGFLLILVSGALFLYAKRTYASVVCSPCNCPPDLYSCGFDDLLDQEWVCGIKINPAVPVPYCKGSACPLCIFAPQCSNANVSFKGNACPSTTLYNGLGCEFYDGCLAPSEHSLGKTGVWNSSDEACVQCQAGKPTRAFLLADGSKKCWGAMDSSGGGLSCGGWNQLACATDFAGKCDYGCGADKECNHADNAVGVTVLGGFCNNCLFTTVAPICGNGVLDPGEQCDPGPPAQDAACPGQCQAGCTCPAPPPPPPGPGCEKTIPCSCGCPAGISCSSGQCKGGLVPCGRSCDDPCTETCECAPCTLCHLFVLIKRIIDFITIDIIFPLAVLMLVVGGIMFLTASGSSERISMAKKILTATAIGILICFTSWLIIDEIINVLVPAASPYKAWNTISCDVPEGGAIACVTSGACDGVCPIGCSVAQDPDCGCKAGDSCCGIGCDPSSDSDCGAPSCSPPCDDPTTKPCGAPISPKTGCTGTCPSGTSCTVVGESCVAGACVNIPGTCGNSIVEPLLGEQCDPPATGSPLCCGNQCRADCKCNYVGDCTQCPGAVCEPTGAACTSRGIGWQPVPVPGCTTPNVCCANVGAAPVCTNKDPTVSLSLSPQSGIAGTKLNYIIGVKNNDDPATCTAPRNFNLLTVPPSLPGVGWGYALSTTIVAGVAPGTIVYSASIDVTSDPAATPVSYNFQVTASGAGPTQGTGTGIYTVIPPLSLPHITVTAPVNVTVGTPFTVTVQYTHDTGANGAIHLRWVDAYFDIDTATTVGCDNGGQPYKNPPNAFAGIYEGIDCSNLTDSTVKTFTFTPLAAGVGAQSMFARAWDLTQDHSCGGGIFDYDRDPNTGICSLNCRNFMTDWPVCDTGSLPITVNAAAGLTASELTALGDISGAVAGTPDCKIDARDIGRINTAFGPVDGNPTWDSQADLDKNLVVDNYDALILQNITFGWGCH